MKKTLLITFTLLCCFFISISKVFANDMIYDVKIMPTSEEEVYNKNLQSIVTVEFKTKELYNSKVYLSYHILGENNDVLVNENQRVPFKLNENGTAKVTLSINLEDLEETKKAKKLFIKYDLVDEKNVYWFSTKNDIIFETFSTVYTDNTFKKVVRSLKLEIIHNPIVFFVNILCCLSALYTYYVIKKKDLL